MIFPFDDYKSNSDWVIINLKIKKGTNWRKIYSRDFSFVRTVDIGDRG